MTIGRRGVLLAAIAAAFVFSTAGSAGAASIDPTEWDFGNQNVGTTSATKTFTVTRGQICVPFGGCFPNPGDTISPAAVTGPFAVVPGFGCILPVSSCTVDVTFLPVAGGLATGTLSAGTGSAVLRGTGVGGVIQQAKSNQFSFGKLKLNKNKGTATLTIDVPGAGNLALGGNGVVPKRLAPGGRAVASKVVSAAGKVKLKIKAKGKKKAKLNDTGKAKVKPKITFTPTGGIPATQAKKITLKKNL